MDVIKRLGRMIKPYRGTIVMALVLQTVVILTRLFAPFFTRDIVNKVIPAQDLELLLPL